MSVESEPKTPATIACVTGLTTQELAGYQATMWLYQRDPQRYAWLLDEPLVPIIDLEAYMGSIDIDHDLTDGSMRNQYPSLGQCCGICAIASEVIVAPATTVHHLPMVQ